MSKNCGTCLYQGTPTYKHPCDTCWLQKNWEPQEEEPVKLAVDYYCFPSPPCAPTTSKEIHDQLHVLYSQYNDLGEALSRIDDVDNSYTYELIQARYNALAQEIESISKKEWREA
jgi:hypothetical protein